MLINGSLVKVLDNSGALVVKCFRIFGKAYGVIGTKIVVSVQTFRSGKKVKKGEVYKALIIQTRSKYSRDIGSSFSFCRNGVILWKRTENSPLGTRIKYLVSFEFRFIGYLKIILISLGTF